MINDNLKRIRLLKGLSLKEAGDLLKMSPTAVLKYEKGELVPDSKKITQFANAYQVKCIDILTFYNTPKMKFNSFRKKSILRGQKLELLKSIIKRDIAKYFEVIRLGNIRNNRIILKKYNCNNYEDIELIANKFREEIKISSKQPLFDMIDILENLGIIIIQIGEHFDGFDGFSEIVEGIPVIVLPSDIIDGARQRFTIAHELGHLIINVTNNEINEEDACQKFASALLMPRDAIINEFGFVRNNISLFELIAFKNEFKVSFSAIIYRLKDLNVISLYLFKKLRTLINKDNGLLNKEYIEPEKTYQFKKHVYKLEVDNIISSSRACELLGVTYEEYTKENYYY